MVCSLNQYKIKICVDSDKQSSILGGQQMYTAIKNYCNNESENGLFLLDMPTGFGKTYSVLKYIYEASIDESNKNKRFFFITTLKKNLPKDDLKKWFENNGQLDKFKEKFLFIDSNADCVIENLTKDLENTIPDNIRTTDEYKNLIQDVRFLQKPNLPNKYELKDFIGSIKDNLRTKSEPKFRRMIQNILSKNYSNVDKRLFAIKTDPDWKWLGLLYPAVFTRDKQIIFMSMDKFLSRNATIVEPSYMFYNTDIINNANIFIDEFDATKETLLNNIIQNGLRDKIDYVDLFKEIYSALHTNVFPTALTTASRQRNGSKYKYQTLQSVIDGIKEKADVIHDNYSLQFSHRTSTDVLDNNKNFLFQDYQFHSILDGKKSYITTKSDTEKRINSICFSQNKPTEERQNIQVMLGKLRGFIKYFQIGINILAINYMQCKSERRQNGEDEFSLESSIRSVLSEFRLSSMYIDYITSQILISSPKAKGNIENSDFDLSFYENGFRFYSFEDDSIHDMQSKIMMCSFQTTPEKILLRFCEKAKVIGISATATIPTVIGNYDLNYLKSKIQQAFTMPSEDDKTRMSREFSKSFSGYDKVNINVQLLRGNINGQYSKDSWKLVFENYEFAEKVFDGLEIELFDDKNSYNKERYVRVALAYKNFILNNDIRSFLCVLTKHPKNNDKYLNRNRLNTIFEYICRENNLEFNSYSIYNLDGEEYDRKKDEIINKLSNGNKLFVISVYQTIGVGQNLQYKIPEEIKDSLVKINNRESCDEKDFDAIYLDKPTNLLVNLCNNLAEEDFVKYLFHTEFLQEVSELPMLGAFSHIKKAFTCYMSGSNNKLPYAPNAYESKSVALLSTRTIIQAIGRICRTNNKQTNIYIFADDRISETIDVSVANDRMLNKEFTALLEKVIKKPSEKSYEEYINNGQLISVKANKFINNMLREDWNNKRIEQWQKLRELVLTSPTMSYEDISKDFIAKNFYIELPNNNNTLYYLQEEDYNKVEISFVKNGKTNMEVSSTATKLKELMSFTRLKNFFIKKGWATDFEKNEYIMCPTLFNNIYKGALGEVSGRWLLWDALNCNMEEISDSKIFELFDFKIQNSSIYVDLKNWHESTSFSNHEMIQKIKTKADEIPDCKCVLIINVLADNEWDIHKIKENGIEIIEIPSLLINNKGVSYNNKSLKEIRRCIDEYFN